MIIVNLTGGLGNQLFQYAMALSVAERKNNALFFDITSFKWDALREYELYKLGVKNNVASDALIHKIKNTPSNFFSTIKKKLNIDLAYYEESYIKEKKFEFDPNFPKFNNDNVYFDGYWQSEKYFNNIRNILLRNLTFNKISDECIEFINRIQNTVNSVSLHIRRGDYALNTETKEYHGLVDLEYYIAAIDILNQRLVNPTFFVFSDDKSYARSLFGNKINFTIVDAHFADFEELYLMSTCENQVIANSSFSWWGAWLNRNGNKQVIAPKIWFKNKEMQNQTGDLIPCDWFKI